MSAHVVLEETIEFGKGQVVVTLVFFTVFFAAASISAINLCFLLSFGDPTTVLLNLLCAWQTYGRHFGQTRTDAFALGLKFLAFGVAPAMAIGNNVDLALGDFGVPVARYGLYLPVLLVHIGASLVWD